MMNLHILSDPVSDFWNCPIKGFNKSYWRRFLVPNYAAGHMPPSPGVTHVGWVAISCSHTMKTTLNVVFISREQLIAAVSTHVGTHNVMYCTVLYCTVLYCTVLCPTTSQLQIGTKMCVVVDIDHVIMIVVTKTPYLGQCPNRGGGLTESQPPWQI